MPRGFSRASVHSRACTGGDLVPTNRHGIVRVSFFRQRWRARSPWGAPRSLSIYGLMTHADSIKGSAPHSILGRITHTSPSSHSSHTQLSQLSHARTEHHTRAPDHPERFVCAACAHRQYTMAPCAPQKYMQGSRTRAEERAPHAATRWRAPSDTLHPRLAPSDTLHLASDTPHWTRSIRHAPSDTLHPTRSIRLAPSDTLKPTRSIRHARSIRHTPSDSLHQTRSIPTHLLRLALPTHSSTQR